MGIMLGGSNLNSINKLGDTTIMFATSNRDIYGSGKEKHPRWPSSGSQAMLAVIKRFLSELKDRSHPASSTLNEHKGDVQDAAFVPRSAGALDGECPGHPTRDIRLVYGDGCMPRQGRRFEYAHYDVQPPDPWNERITPPFEPTERITISMPAELWDDNGQLWMEVTALEALMQANGGKLPIHVKVPLK